MASFEVERISVQVWKETLDIVATSAKEALRIANSKESYEHVDFGTMQNEYVVSAKILD